MFRVNNYEKFRLFARSKIFGIRDPGPGDPNKKMPEGFWLNVDRVLNLLLAKILSNACISLIKPPIINFGEIVSVY